jgi:hypothetical protein
VYELDNLAWLAFLGASVAGLWLGSLGKEVLSPVRIVLSGEIRQFGAGDVVLLEDTVGEGHCSKALFNEVRHSIFVTVPEDVVF